RAVATTVAPSVTSPAAMARPRPLPAPVTQIVFPSRGSSRLVIRLVLDRSVRRAAAGTEVTRGPFSTAGPPTLGLDGLSSPQNPGTAPTGAPKGEPPSS